MEANPYYLKDSEGDSYNQYPEFQVWEDGKQAGIKEVVEWVNQNIAFANGRYHERWHAYLKDKGIE